MPKRAWYAVRRSLTSPAVRYPPDPRALFVLVMCVVSGFPLILANAAPQSIVAQLDDPWVVTWGVMLTGGSLLTLVGALWQSPNGVVAEQVGSIALGSACVIFAAAIWGYVRWQGSVPMLLTFGFGVACIWRYAQLVAFLKAVEQLAQEIRNEAAPE
jgi:hypothetical protein